MRFERRDQRLELRLFDESPGGENQRNLGRLACRLTDAGPAEKFSIAGTRPVACSAKNVTSAARDVGNSTPTRSAGARPLRDGRPERVACGDEPAGSSSASVRDRRRSDAAPVLTPRVEKRIEQRRVDARSGERRLHHLVTERAAKRRTSRAAGHAFRASSSRAPEARGSEFSETSRRRTLPASRENGVNSTPSMRTGTQRGARALGNHRGALVHLHQRAGRRDAPFGKDDARRAALDRANHGANRQRICRIDRQRVDER